MNKNSLFQAFRYYSAAVSGERVKLYTGKKGGGGERGRGKSEGTPVNIRNKGSFRYTGFQYTLLLVDYDYLLLTLED